MRFCFVLITLFMLAAGCAEKAEHYPDTPEAVIRAYFDSLYKGKYDRAVEFYGGSYEELYYSKTESNNLEELFKAYITINGGQAVKINSIVETTEIQPNEEYSFKLTFLDKQDKSFRDGMVYTYSVKKINGQYKVMELPPYLA